MGQSKLELAVGTGQWDAGLKKAQQALNAFTQSQGGLQQALEKDNGDMQKFVQMMAKMDSTANTAKGQMNDYKRSIEQLSAAYNQMSSAQQASIGQDYLKTIDALKQKFQDTKQQCDELSRSLNGINLPDMSGGSGGGLFKGLGDKMSGALQVFGGNMMTKAAGAAMNLASEIGGAITQGIELAKQGEGIRIAFERLGRGDILDGLRKATHGTVTDIELMKAAVKFNDFKLPVEELGTMLAFAQQKAKDTGQSIDYMVDSIVTGLGRKSLMILDNLGLSAAEIKEKMKDTGDMTKAVGEIIREQMAKAGDYVETAADRAAQANVDLQNKMEELGRKFAPLQEASNNLWTSMKIGILDIIGGPLTNFINKLTEAGRIAQQYGVLGGNAKVGRLTQNLSNARDENRQNIYQQQQQQFWRYINRRENYMKDRQRWINNPGDEKLRKHLLSEQEAFGTSNVGEIQAQINAAKKMLADYQQAAKTILSPVKADIDTSGAVQSIDTLKAKLKDLEAQRKKAIEAGDSDLAKNLLTQINQTKSDIRGLNPNALKTGGSNNDPTAKIQNSWDKAFIKSMNADNLKAEFDHVSVFSMFKDQAKFDPENILGSKDAWESYKDTVTGVISGIGDSMDNLTQWTKNFDPYKEKMNELTRASQQQKAAMNLGAQAAQNFGAALQGIEDPSAKAAGTVTQAIASIALGFAMASSNANTAGTGWGWLAWLAAGMSAMATTIGTVHSLTGYAQGGEIKGNSYSGDNIAGLVDGKQLIGLNAGEIVLNQAQQANVAHGLQGAGGNLHLEGILQGENILISTNRTAKRKGYGELMFWQGG